MKSTRVVLKIIRVTCRFRNICVWASSVFPSPRSCAVPLSFRVALVVWWCGRAATTTCRPPVRWRGPPGLANFDFRALFLGTLKDFFPSWVNLVRARFWGQGWSLLSPVAWLWAVCGCSPGPAVVWQPSSRRRWSEKLYLVAGGLCAWIPCLLR